jgi:putative nucleotidyltransferase with HDIG domain
MKEIIVRVSEIKPGMILSRDVFNDNGVIIIGKDTELNDFLIDQLAMLEIDNVHVKVKESELKEEYKSFQYKAIDIKKYNTYEEVKEKYEQKAEEVEKIFENISSEEDIDEANHIALSIVKSSDAVGDILKCMKQIKEMDKYIYYHSLNVASVCNLIGSWLSMSEDELQELVLAALLHDIGKLKIPKEYFNLTSLTEEQRALFEKHPKFGCELIKHIDNVSTRVCEAIVMHHEKEDGSGFPEGIRGDEINLFAKIISVADLYSTITLDRVYKRTDTPFAVFKLFETSMGLKFDPVITYVLIKNIAQFYVGDEVKLSNGKVGKIVFINEEFVSKPLIKMENGEIFNLVEHPDVSIVRML